MLELQPGRPSGSVPNQYLVELGLTTLLRRRERHLMVTAGSRTMHLIPLLAAIARYQRRSYNMPQVYSRRDASTWRM